MTTIEKTSQSRKSEWSWGILLVVSAFVVLNGIGWFFMGPSLSTFEQDTGVPLSEVKEAYPTVTQLVALQARNTAIILPGFG